MSRHNSAVAFGHRASLWPGAHARTPQHHTGKATANNTIATTTRSIINITPQRRHAAANVVQMRASPSFRARLPCGNASIR